MHRRLIHRLILALALLLFGIPTAFTQGLSSTNISGGSGGNGFSDPQPSTGARVTEVRIRSGDQIDSVQMVYALSDGRTTTGARHGGSGGGLNAFTLNTDEYIIGISGRFGDTIDSMQFITNQRTSPLYGGRGGSTNYRIDVPGGNQAVGFIGRAGDLLDAIGLMYTPVYSQRRRLGSFFPSNQPTTKPTAGTSIAGGRGGTAFSDNEFPQGARIAEVRVRAGDRVDAVQMIYILADGRLLDGQRHGGGGGNESIIRLDSDEYITGISGRCGDTIDSLRIITNKRTSQLFGGRGGSRDYRIDVPAGNQAVGFSGRAGESLDGVGLLYSAVTQGRFRRLFGRP